MALRPSVPIADSPAPWRTRDDDNVGSPGLSNDDETPGKCSLASENVLEGFETGCGQMTIPPPSIDPSPFSGFTVESLGLGHPGTTEATASARQEDPASHPGGSPHENKSSLPSPPHLPPLSLLPPPHHPTPFSNLFNRFQSSSPNHHEIKNERGTDEEENVDDGNARNEQILSLESSGRALVLSSRGLERVEMNADVAKEFFESHDFSKEKLRALQIIGAEKVFVKGTSEYRLLTSTMSEMGRAIAQFCRNRGIQNPRDPSAKMLMNSLFEAWMRTRLPHLYETKVRPCDGRTAMGFLRHLTRVTFYCCFKKSKKSVNQKGASAITFPGFD